MSRLIDADKIDFNEVFGGQSEFAKDTREAAQSLIDAQPPIEAVPAVHGEWKHKSYGFVICSECGNVIERLRRTKFCAECGADMRRG